MKKYLLAAVAALAIGAPASAARAAVNQCDMLWNAFHAADMLRSQEQVKPGISKGFVQAAISGERIGRLLLKQDCVPAENRERFSVALDTLHELGAMMSAPVAGK
jgi:hypothetical protein